jgi:RsiW-degrading membrane proteinase PrsW (M82 family)
VQESLYRTAALLSAILPVVWLGLLLIYAARKRMTLEAVTTAFTAGFFAALLILVCHLTVSAVVDENAFGIKGAVSISFLTAALPEEAAKLTVLLTIVYRHEDIRNPLDRILAGGWVGLGFAGLENVFYIFARLLSDEKSWPILALGRAGTAVLGHVMMGLLMGTLLARAFDEKAHKGWWITAAFLAPLLLHGLYNICVLSLRDEPVGFLSWAERWHLGLGMGFFLAVEAWLTVFLVRQGMLGWSRSFPPTLKTSRPRWIEHCFTALLVLTVILAIGMIGLGSLGVWKRYSVSVWGGAGIAWLGAVYLARILGSPAKESPLVIQPSPSISSFNGPSKSTEPLDADG